VHILLRGFVGFDGARPIKPGEAPPPITFDEMQALVARAKGG